MFDERKGQYFTNLGLSLRDAFKLYKKFGLLEKVERQPIEGEEHTKRRTRKHQAPEHMMVVTTRAMILGEWLGLNSTVVAELSQAAAIHDAYKAHEHAITKPLNFTWESFEIAAEKETQALRDADVSPNLINLAQAAGHPLNEAQRKLALENPSDQDWAWLVIFYVDNFTSGMSWASGNPIEERFESDRQKYFGFNKSAIGKIEGHPEEKGFDALIRVGKLAQQKIVKRIFNLTGANFDPNKLPQIIDQEIKRRISTY